MIISGTCRSETAKVMILKKMTAMMLCLGIVLSLAGCVKKEEDTAASGDTCLAVCIDGVTYYDTGKTVSAEPDEGTIEYVEIPLGGTSGTVEAFSRLKEGIRIVCLINDEWYEFVAK